MSKEASNIHGFFRFHISSFLNTELIICSSIQNKTNEEQARRKQTLLINRRLAWLTAMRDAWNDAFDVNTTTENEIMLFVVQKYTVHHYTVVKQKDGEVSLHIPI
jgi:hypothetical protein